MNATVTNAHGRFILRLTVTHCGGCMHQEELEYRLVVWHPYTDLAMFLADAKATDISSSAW